MRSNQAFKDETTLPVGVELPKASTHLKMLEKLQELFSDIDEGVQWVLTKGNFRNVLDFLARLSWLRYFMMRTRWCELE